MKDISLSPMNVLLFSFIDSTKVQALRMAVNDNYKAFLPHQFWSNQALSELQKIDYKNVIKNKIAEIICLSGRMTPSVTDLKLVQNSLAVKPF